MPLKEGELTDGAGVHRDATDAVHRELRRCRIRLYVASFLVDVVSAAYGLVVSAHAETHLAATPAELGYLGTAFSGAYGLGCLLLGGWSDRRGSTVLIWASLSCVTFVVLPAVMLAGALEWLPAFCVANAAYGLSIAIFWPPVMRELSLLSPGRLLWRSVGAFNVCWAAGTALGNFLGPTLYGQFALEFTVLCLIACAVLALGTAAFRIRSIETRREDLRTPGVDEARGALFLNLNARE